MHAIRIRSWYAALVARRTVAAFLSDQGLTWSAATAFYLVLSVPPLLIAFSSLAFAVVGEDTARQFISQRMSDLLPSETSAVRQLVDGTVSSGNTAAALSLAFLLVSGSRVFAALSRAINIMWEHVEDAGWLRRQLSRLLLLLVVGGLFAATLAIELAAAILHDRVQLPPGVGWALRSQVLPAALVFLALFATYVLLPHGAASWRAAAVGALVGTLLLRVAQAAFGFFLSTVAGFQSAYGPLAGIAILMTWGLIGSGVVLLAAELVAVIDRRRIPGRKSRANEPAGP